MEKKTSYRVMQTHNLEYLNTLYYRIACDCSTTKDDIEIEVEYDEDGVLLLTLSGTHKVADWWYHPSWLGQMWKRLKLSLQILFTGYMETHGEFLLMEEKHIDSIIDFLNEIKLRKKQCEKSLNT